MRFSISSYLLKSAIRYLFGALFLLVSALAQTGDASAASKASSTGQTSGPSSDFRKIKVAVLDFQQNGTFDSHDIGKIVAEWFTTALVDSGRFEIIERRLLQQILEEQKIGSSGLIDPRSASQLGRLLGVKTVVSGTVQNYDRTFELNTRLIDVETGSIIVAESVRANSTSSLNTLVNQVADKIIRYFPLQGYVVQRTGERGIIDLGRKAGIRSGMLFRVFVEGAPLKHPMTGEILSVERIDKGLIRIKEVKEKTSTGIIEKETCKNCVKVGQLVSTIMAEDDISSEPPPPISDESPALAIPSTPAPPAVSSPARPFEAKVFKVLKGHRNDIKSVAVASNGYFAASADSGGVISLWDLKTWTLVETMKNSRGDINAVAFSPDSKLLVSGGDDKEAVVWSLVDRKPLYKTKIRDKITSITFSGDSLVAIGTDSKKVYVWDFTRDKDPIKKSTSKDVLCIAASPDGKQFATGSNDDAVTIWNSSTGEKQQVLKGHDSNVRAIIYSAGGKWLISAGDDNNIMIWDPVAGSLIRKIQGHRENINFLAMTADGRQLVSSESRKSDGAVITWNPSTGTETRRFLAPRRINSLAINPNGRYIFGAVDKDLTVFSLD
jgi:WD40 repeat protein/curli biogenesis system outer membrane secretion channel CsgG